MSSPALEYLHNQLSRVQIGRDARAEPATTRIRAICTASRVARAPLARHAARARCSYPFSVGFCHDHKGTRSFNLDGFVPSSSEFCLAEIWSEEHLIHVLFYRKIQILKSIP
ncbi:hypothetical protein NQ317_006321, partial [Molorchus minor]